MLQQHIFCYSNKLIIPLRRSRECQSDRSFFLILKIGRVLRSEKVIQMYYPTVLSVFYSLNKKASSFTPTSRWWCLFVICSLMCNIDHFTYVINTINLLNLQLKMPKLPCLQLHKHTAQHIHVFIFWSTFSVEIQFTKHELPNHSGPVISNSMDEKSFALVAMGFWIWLQN